jgi:hypothetical protein
VWALDYQFELTATGIVIQILHVVDEFTRESLAELVDHSIDADATVVCLDKIVGKRGRPPSSSAATTAPSSRPMRCETGAASPAPAPATPNPARRRTRVSSPTVPA